MVWGELVVDADGTFEEGPMRIMDSRDQVLRCKASQDVMAAPRSEGGNMRARGHDVYHLSFLIRG